MRQGLVHLPLVKEPFFRLKRPRVEHPHLFPVRSIYTEDSRAPRRHPQVEKPGLHRKPWRVRQQPHRKGILKGFFDFPLRQRAIEIEGRTIPIKLHSSLIVNVTPMQCLYIVFTHGVPILSTDFFQKNYTPIPCL